MKKKYFKDYITACKVLDEIQTKANIFLCLEYDDRKKLFFIEY